MMTFLSDLQSLDAHDQELVLERAAIIEFDGSLPRALAEYLAMEEVERGTWGAHGLKGNREVYEAGTTGAGSNGD